MPREIVPKIAIVFWFAASVACLDTPEFQRNLPAKVIWGVLGKDVELPCDITPPIPSDNFKMVFWFKDTDGMPLYSLDARGGPLGEASHLAMSDDLGSRSYFIKDEQPSKARLRIRNVTIHDEGVFRCRVDFDNSPTRNFQVNLTLPSAPRIFNAEGNEIKRNSSAGPFLEGDELFLSCQVTGGRPRPSLTWWHNNTLIDGVVDSSETSFTIVNQLTRRHTPRSFWKSHLECRASSSAIAGDVVRVVPIVVLLKPNKVKIVTPNDLLSIHKPQNVKCETSGSYPPAKLTWLLDGKPIRNAVVTEEVTDSFTGSIISLNVVADNDGKDLVCRANNPRFPGGSLEDRRQIHVAYPPKVSVKLDSGVNSPVKEGTDVTLRCDSSARPSPYGYRWYHDGHLVALNESGGVLPIDHILTLKSIQKKSQGQYACFATNTEGGSYSSPFDLIIQYAPRCKKGYEVMRVGIVKHEPLVVQCHVDSIPEDVRFSWTYNTSKGVFPVLGAKMHNNGGVSTLHFNPSTEDIDSLSCWATNDVGKQEQPCLFYIIPAVPNFAETPESPRHCILRNASHGGLEVACVAGADGGLHQSFVLEVNDVTIPSPPPGVTTLSDQGEAKLLYRALGDKPMFRLHSLHPGREYQIMVYAENAKGRSEPPVLLPSVRVEAEIPADTLHETDTTTRPGSEGYPSSRQNLTVILVALTAAAVLLIVGIVATAVTIACRKTPAAARRQTTRRKSSDDLEMSEAGFSEGFQRRSAQYRASMYGLQETEDRISRLIDGPDLILAPVSFSQQNSEY
ncbi:hemicentin-2 isoform X2 [Tribolium castaneum]|uniref:hemicentin-2 isoform X2 n=1 Tax=Tribolium castaneum TaxID=7070 RepID=UPI00077D98C4|nr:PREDICTED: hemicentin-2 isoform X2 [Tribolium castaneum]|eukprot:XP_015837630.1 PREDICTED: hemicentin-2 isoform X2 [Tribolium castaneum]